MSRTATAARLTSCVTFRRSSVDSSGCNTRHGPPDHILIVDDDAEIRSLLASICEKNGLRATAVADGRGMWQALDARTDRPDRARPDAPRRRRPDAVPQPARKFRHPGHHAHGARRGDRPHRRPGDGCRRLSGQAVQRARAAGAHQGDPAPRAQPAAEPATARAQRALRFADWVLDTAQRQAGFARRRRDADRAAPSTDCCASS